MARPRRAPVPHPHQNPQPQGSIPLPPSGHLPEPAAAAAAAAAGGLGYPPHHGSRFPLSSAEAHPPYSAAAHSVPVYTTNPPPPAAARSLHPAAAQPSQPAAAHPVPVYVASHPPYPGAARSLHPAAPHSPYPPAAHPQHPAAGPQDSAAHLQDPSSYPLQPALSHESQPAAPYSPQPVEANSVAPAAQPLTPVRVSRSSPRPNSQVWTTSLFDCCDDPLNAIITLCMPCVTFGQIANIIDKGNTPCISATITYVLRAVFTGGPCLYSSAYRTRLRATFGLVEAPGSDCLVHLACELCALCQAYRELTRRGFDPAIGWEANNRRHSAMAMIPPRPQLMMT